MTEAESEDAFDQLGQLMDGEQMAFAAKLMHGMSQSTQAAQQRVMDWKDEEIARLKQEVARLEERLEGITARLEWIMYGGRAPE